MYRLSGSLRLILLPLLVGCFALQAHAHNPHDPVLGLGISPAFNSDGTMFVATISELTWGPVDVLKSVNGGSDWQRQPRGLDNRHPVSAIRVSPHFKTDKTVFVATTGDSGIYVSRTKGRIWTPANEGLPKLVGVRRMKVASTGADRYVLFAAMNDGSLWRLSSTEAAWQPVLPKTSDTRQIALAPDYESFPRIVRSDSKGKVWVSESGGLSWRPSTATAIGTVQDVAIAPGPALEIFVAGGQRGFYYSNDGGNTFTNIRSNLPDEPVDRIAVSPEYATDKSIFCTTLTKAVFRSTDRGSTWSYSPVSKITGQTSIELEFSELQVSPTYAADKAVFLSSYEGLFISRDGGVSWAESQTRVDLITGLAFSPAFASDKTIVATSYAGEGLYISRNGGSDWNGMGRNWTDEGSKLSIMDSVYFSYVGSGNADLFASRNWGQIGRSSDHGLNWTIFEIPVFPEVSSKDVYPTVIAVAQKSISNQYDPRNYRIFAGTRAHGMLRSADNRLTWDRLTALPATGRIVSLVTGRTTAERTALFAGTNTGELWNSVDGGESWSPVGVGALVSRKGRAAVYAALSPAFAQDGLMLAGTNGGLFLSFDRGDSWRRVSFGAFGESFVVEQIEFPSDFVQTREAFVGIRGKGLYKFNIAVNGRTSGPVNIGASLLKENVQFGEFRLSPSIAQDGVIVGVAGHAIWRTSDRGVNWERANPVVPSR